ncbi:MAG TPA: hypothetical protein VH439_13310 [Gemmatimonadales bacterium]
MKAFATALLVCVAACGQGRAIFNVDVYSFLQGTGRDTFPYVIPPSLSTTVNTVQKVSLPPGFGSSGVDSVRITSGNVTLVNDSGAGSIGISVYFAGDSAGTYSAPAALTISPTAVSGADTVAVPISGDISAVVDSLFNQSVLWVRIEATGQNSSLTQTAGGTGILTALMIRVVLQDKVF